MRLWHKDLIEVLPRQQLLGQWRELNSIFKLQNSHVLINFVYDYEKVDLFIYSNMVICEMQRRGYKYNLTNRNNYFGNIGLMYTKYDLNIEPFKEKMNNRYFIQCFFNLQEKYDCGAINKKEWNLIQTCFNCLNMPF